MSCFEIRTEHANKSNSIPSHFNIHLKGSDFELVTVWAERELAEAIVEAMDARARRKV
jgi:hypothetical protein